MRWAQILRDAQAHLKQVRIHRRGSVLLTASIPNRREVSGGDADDSVHVAVETESLAHEGEHAAAAGPHVVEGQ